MQSESALGDDAVGRELVLNPRYRNIHRHHTQLFERRRNGIYREVLFDVFIDVYPDSSSEISGCERGSSYTPN
jgi:hypothetical protein